MKHGYCAGSKELAEHLKNTDTFEGPQARGEPSAPDNSTSPIYCFVAGIRPDKNPSAPGWHAEG